jgi:hypothetical protein
METKMQTTKDPTTPYIKALERVTENVKNNSQLTVWKTTFLYKQ